MKRFSRLISVLLIAAMIFCCSACGNGDGVSTDKDNVVMQYGDITLDDAEFRYIASYIKDMVVYNQQNYLYQYTGQVYDEASILSMQIDSDTTIAEYIKDYSVEFAQQLLIIEKICADANISITEQEDLDKIGQYVDDIEYAYGGTDLFEIALQRLGFSRDGIERFQRFSVNYELLYDARYGENGSAKVSSDSVNKYFTENYLKYDGVMYSYLNSSDGSAITFEYTDDEITEYFNNNFVKVQHILYMTVGSDNKPLSEDAIAKKEKTANEAYSAIMSGEKTFDDYKKDTEDGQHEYVFTYGKMVKEFEKASFEMNVGETRLVKTEYGYHIIQKLEMTNTDLTGTVDDNGEVKNSRKDEVIKAMSASDIRAEALETLEKLNNGELVKYPEKSDDKKYYINMGSSFINKSDTNYATLVNILKDLEYGVYSEKEFVGDATYILRNIKFSAEDITSDIYSEIEENMAVESYAEYVQSFYDSVSIDQTFVDEFDIVTLPLLEKEFYVE